MNPSNNEGEPQNRFGPNEQAVNRAISFTSDRIQKAAANKVPPQEAGQLGVDYVFYTHQRESLTLRRMDSSPTVNRDSKDIGKGMYDVTVNAVAQTGKLLDSLNTNPDLIGVREYLLKQADLIKLMAKSFTLPGQTPNEKVIEREKKRLAQAEAFKKVALAIPDSGITVEKPKVFAWMDSRFNGEDDIHEDLR